MNCQQLSHTIFRFCLLPLANDVCLFFVRLFIFSSSSSIVLACARASLRGKPSSSRALFLRERFVYQFRFSVCVYAFFIFSVFVLYKRVYNTVTTARSYREEERKSFRNGSKGKRKKVKKERRKENKVNIAQQKQRIKRKMKEGKRGNQKKKPHQIINYQGMFVRVSFSRLMDYFWFCLFQYIRLTLPIRVIHTLTVLLFHHWNIQTISSAVVIFDRFVLNLFFDSQ